MIVSGHGIYTAPREIRIAGIDAVVVDPHNEVFPYWAEFSGGEQAAVIHVDEHPDMEAVAVMGLEQLDGDLSEYAKQMGCASFIPAAIYYGLVGAAFHFNPDYDRIDAYGRFRGNRFVGTPSLVLREGRIRFDANSAEPTAISPRKLKNELKGFRGKLILDIDLDAFVSVEDYNALSALTGNKAPGYDYALTLISAISQMGRLRLRDVSKLLEGIPVPGLITIARSQTPQLYALPLLADDFERIVIGELGRLYAKR